jgi:hypothetical protein
MIAPRPPPNDEHALEAALRQAAALVGTAMQLALALDQLGDLDLPPASTPAVDQAQLRAIASLYLAADLESAGVVAAVETIAGLGGAGGLQLDLGSAAPLVAQFWRSRRDRATPEERDAAYARLFGARADGFEEAMLALCEALYKLDEAATNATYGGLSQQARVRSAARTLSTALADAGGGITVFLAQEILQGLRAALAVLNNPGLRRALGAHDTWAAIAAIDRLSRTKRPDPRLYVRRGKAGMIVLAWLADAAPHIDDAAPALVGLDHPVIAAAYDWMQAELAIGEAAGGAAAAPNPVASAQPGPPPSPWAALAA